MRTLRLVILPLLLAWQVVAWSPTHARAQCADTPAALTLAASQDTHDIVATVSPLPPAPIVVTFVGDKGASASIQFDPAQGALTRRVSLPGGQDYRVVFGGSGTVVGDEPAIPWACWTTDPTGINDRTARLGYATLTTAPDPTKARFTVHLAVVAQQQRNSVSAVRIQDTPAVSQESLDRSSASAVPDAVARTLELLAEIAMDKAKAQALRIFKTKLVDRVCDGLTIGTVFPRSTEPTARLLPATCGQLENLRLGDLGGSAKALVTALREDLAAVLVPNLITSAQAPTDEAIVKLVTRLVIRASSGQLSADEVRLALVAFVGQQLGAVPVTGNLAGPLQRALLRAVTDAAVACDQGCSAADILDVLRRRLMARPLLGTMMMELVVRGMVDAEITPALRATVLAELANAGGKFEVEAGNAIDAVLDTKADAAKRMVEAVERLLTASTFQQFQNLDYQRLLKKWLNPTGAAPIHVPDKVVELEQTLRGALPELAGAVARLRAVMTNRAGATPLARAGETVAVILDLIELARCTDGATACRTQINQLRDIALGAIEGDYLRALGGLTSALKDRGVAIKHRRAIALVTSIMSYADTYQKTKDEDPKVAREQRKKALEALIAAETDRTGRAAGWVVSLGAMVGFQAGYRDIYGTDDGSGAAGDLRLPLGVTAHYLAADEGDWSVLAHLGVADLALLAASSASEDLEPKLHWSDFVEVSGYFGVAYGRQTPATLGLAVGWAPGLRYVDASTDGTTMVSYGGRGVFRVGVLAAVDVPFFDMN